MAASETGKEQMSQIISIDCSLKAWGKAVALQHFSITAVPAGAFCGTSPEIEAGKLLLLPPQRGMTLRATTPAKSRKGLIKGVNLCGFTSQPPGIQQGNWRTCYCSWISAWSPNSPAILWKFPSPPTWKIYPLSALMIVKGQQFLISGSSFSLCTLPYPPCISCTLQCWTRAGMAAVDTWHHIIHPEQKGGTAMKGQELESPL